MKYIIIIIVISVSFSFCRKDSFNNPTMASVSLVNAVVGGSTVRLGSYTTNVTNNNYWSFIVADNSDLYFWPIGDSLHPYYTSAKFTIEDRATYSLYLCGFPSSVEGIVVKENIPYYTDSICGVRIINLSPNSGAFNITLSTTPTTNEVTNLAYKQFTEFRTYPAKASNVSYTFQIRKALNNNVVFSYVLLTPRFANVTLVIRGLVDKSPAIGVIRVNNDRF